MRVFYQPTIEKHPFLSMDDSKHAIKVLRLKRGDKIEIVDGKGKYFEAEIVDPDPKKCHVEIIDEGILPPKLFYIHVAIAPTKNIDRIEWFVEKSVEFGIDEITFLKCDNSERDHLRLDRIEKKAISAMKQSRVGYLPKINDVVNFNDFVRSGELSDDKFIAYVCNSSTPLVNYAMPARSYCILIGPEGDFSKNEIDKANKNGFTAVGLGNTRMRTETAGIAACHILNLIQKQH